MSYKLYGIFKFHWNSHNSTFNDQKRFKIHYHIHSDPESWLGKLRCEDRKIYDNKEDAYGMVIQHRRIDADSRRNEYCVYHKYKHKFIVHECDKDGYWIPSKSESKKAEEWNQSRSNNAN